MTWAKGVDGVDGTRGATKSVYTKVDGKDGTDGTDGTDGDEETADEGDTADEDDDGGVVVLPAPPPASLRERCGSLLGLVTFIGLIVVSVKATVERLDRDINGSLLLPVEAVGAAGAVVSLLERFENVSHRTKASLQMATRDSTRSARQRAVKARSGGRTPRTPSPSPPSPSPPPPPSPAPPSIVSAMASYNNTRAE